MTFTDSIKSCLNKYATFRGRAPRSEYWGFWAFCILTEIAAMIVFGLIGYLCGKGMGDAYRWLYRGIPCFIDVIFTDAVCIRKTIT